MSLTFPIVVQEHDWWLHFGQSCSKVKREFTVLECLQLQIL